MSREVRVRQVMGGGPGPGNDYYYFDLDGALQEFWSEGPYGPHDLLLMAMFGHEEFTVPDGWTLEDDVEYTGDHGDLYLGLYSRRIYPNDPVGQVSGMTSGGMCYSVWLLSAATDGSLTCSFKTDTRYYWNQPDTLTEPGTAGLVVFTAFPAYAIVEQQESIGPESYQPDASVFGGTGQLYLATSHLGSFQGTVGASEFPQGPWYTQSDDIGTDVIMATIVIGSLDRLDDDGLQVPVGVRSPI